MGGIRNRISALRVKQRNMYEERGWQLPEGGAGYSSKKSKATPSKRAAGEEGEVETPTKKPRASRKKKVAPMPERRESSAEEEGEGEPVGFVKAEPEEEMEV